jgi:hypothetical protein
MDRMLWSGTNWIRTSNALRFKQPLYRWSYSAKDYLVNQQSKILSTPVGLDLRREIDGISVYGWFP